MTKNLTPRRSHGRRPFTMGTNIGVLSLLSLATFMSPTIVDGHGYMSSPRTLNWFAAEEGVNGGGTAGLPNKEYCYHCLNANDNVCGKSPGGNNYDDYRDSNGDPMPWISQDNFDEGDVILVKSYLDTHHNGHMELRACPLGRASTPECFDEPANSCTFVQDTLYGMPADPNYPERGYYAGGQGGGIQSFEMLFKLPDGVSGDEVMLQWKYITANSCSPPGYAAYFGGDNSDGTPLPDAYWTSGLGLCVPPYPNDGARSEEWPEQFFNCAEVSIAAGPSEPTVSPAPTKSPTVSPTDHPSVSSQPSTATKEPTVSSTCIAIWTDCNTWDRHNCCEGLICTEVDPGYYKCLTDVCGNPPTPPTSPTPPTNPTPTPPSPTPPSPTPPSPTPPSPTPPSPTPPTADGCCTLNFRDCHANDYCNANESQCTGACGKLWLPNGPNTGCTPLWEPCSNDDECCEFATCGSDNHCFSDGWTPPNPTPPTVPPPPPPAPTPTPPTPTPPTPVTASPVASPTEPQPTEAPVPVTPEPTKAPVVVTPEPTKAPSVVTTSPTGEPIPTTPTSANVRVNQIGYLRDATKIGVVVDPSTSPLSWQVQDSSGVGIVSGITTVYGDDVASGDFVHQADFSSLTEIGSYVLVVDNVGSSLSFDISPSLYTDLPLEAMNYFYFHRMGVEIEAQHLIDDRYARAAIHPGDTSIPPYDGWCETCNDFDLFGSWADAGDYGIYSVNHAISAWTLLNLHEKFPQAFVDGDLNLPESGNLYPDVLDEVDYGSRFMRGMLPSDGGLASHKAHNHAWSAFTITVDGENSATRSAMGPSTAATYAVARTNAQLARAWHAQGGNGGHAEMLWDAARDAWNRADGTSHIYAGPSPGPAVGGGDYPDGIIDDDRYTGAVEMYLTAYAMSDPDVETYRSAMQSSMHYKQMSHWDWASVAGAGTLSLYAVPNDLSASDKDDIEANILAFADHIKSKLDGEGYPSNIDPAEFSGNYPWGSNSFIMNRAIALAYAYDITGDTSYQDYIMRTMDYIMGVNAMHISYVTGYGELAETDTHDRWAWTIGQDDFWPRGWLSGGPNNELINDYETPSVEPAKSYAAPGTAPHAWCSKENTVNWNAPLAWVAWYIENEIVPNLGGCQGNCPPQADGQTLTVQMDESVAFTLTASDHDGSIVSWTVTDQPDFGILTGTEPHLTYTPNPLTTGTDTIRFTVQDDDGAVSKEAIVTFNVRDCDALKIFDVPRSSAYPSVSNYELYEHVHVSEDGPNLGEVMKHVTQWTGSDLHEFSLTVNVSPYHVDLRSCMTHSFSQTNPDFTLSGCGLSGIDGDYWINTEGNNEIWVRKDNSYAIAFTKDGVAPEFCNSGDDTPGTTSSPVGTPATASPVVGTPVTSSPIASPTAPTPATLAPVAVPATISPVASPTPPTTPDTPAPVTDAPVVSPTPRPVTPDPTTEAPVQAPPPPAPTGGGTTCCTDSSLSYQTCKEGWCSENQGQCESSCNGKWLSVPVVPTGCCTWGGGNCDNVDHNSNAGCHYLQSDCEGQCGGTWHYTG